jgi:exodeoxyribonuclease VII small subunit
VTAEPESFEDRFKALSEILARLEEGDLSLDDCLKEYEHGVRAVGRCRELLDKAERRIEELTPAGLKVQTSEE